MKHLWLGSVFMTGLIVTGGNAFAESGNPPDVGAQLPADSRILLADASLDLDVTMEVVDENANSSEEITNVINLPVRAQNQYREMQQKQLSNGTGTAGSTGTGDGQGNGSMPAESRPDSQQGVSKRPSEAPGPGATAIDSRPGTQQEPNRPDSAGQPTTNTPRPDVSVTPTERSTKEKAQEMKNDQLNSKGK